MTHPHQPTGSRHLAGNVFVATTAPARSGIAARTAPSPAHAVIDALTAARTAALTPRADSRGMAQADMRRRLGLPAGETRQ